MDEAAGAETWACLGSTRLWLFRALYFAKSDTVRRHLRKRQQVCVRNTIFQRSHLAAQQVGIWKVTLVFRTFERIERMSGDLPLNNQPCKYQKRSRKKEVGFITR